MISISGNLRENYPYKLIVIIVHNRNRSALQPLSEWLRKVSFSSHVWQNTTRGLTGRLLKPQKSTLLSLLDTLKHQDTQLGPSRERWTRYVFRRPDIQFFTLPQPKTLKMYFKAVLWITACGKFYKLGLKTLCQWSFYPHTSAKIARDAHPVDLTTFSINRTPKSGEEL